MIGVTTDLAYDLAQVFTLPDPDDAPDARAHVIDHFGQLWANQVHSLAYKAGHPASHAYWGPDGGQAANVQTRTPTGEGQPTVEDTIRQLAHDALEIDQADIDRVAAEVTDPS